MERDRLGGVEYVVLGPWIPRLPRGGNRLAGVRVGHRRHKGQVVPRLLGCRGSHGPTSGPDGAAEPCLVPTAERGRARPGCLLGRDPGGPRPCGGCPLRSDPHPARRSPLGVDARPGFAGRGGLGPLVVDGPPPDGSSWDGPAVGSSLRRREGQRHTSREHNVPPERSARRHRRAASTAVWTSGSRRARSCCPVSVPPVAPIASTDRGSGG